MAYSPESDASHGDKTAAAVVSDPLRLVAAIAAPVAAGQARIIFMRDLRLLSPFPGFSLALKKPSLKASSVCGRIACIFA